MRIRKKLPAKLMVSLTAAAMALSTFASVPVSAECAHDWVKGDFVIHTDADCLYPSTDIYDKICSICGEEGDDYIKECGNDKLSHDFSGDTCNLCGLTKQELKDYFGETFDDEAENPGNPGGSEGGEEGGETTPSTHEHKWVYNGETVYGATCNHGSGKYTDYVCEECGETYFTDTVTDPTLGDHDFYDGECRFCEKTPEELGLTTPGTGEGEVTPGTGEGENTPEVNPDIPSGEPTRTREPNTVFGEEAHDWKYFVTIDYPATCSHGSGKMVDYKCSNCGQMKYVEYDFTDAIDHDFDDEEGICIYCDKTPAELGIEDPNPDRHEHEYEIISEEKFEADCTYAPRTDFTFKCKHCDKSYTTSEYVDTKAPLGHDYVDGVCSRCGEQSPNPLPEGQHTHNYVKTSSYSFEAGCDSKGGSSDTMTCAECGDEYYITVYDDNQPALGHNYVDGVCTRCYETEPAAPSNPTTENKGETTPATTEQKPATTTSTAAPTAPAATQKKVTVKKPAVIHVKNKKGKKLHLCWNKVKGADGYQIQYSKKSNFSNKTTKALSKSKTSFSVKKSKGKTYYVRMRAYKNVNGKKVYSSWTTKKKVTIKK